MEGTYKYSDLSKQIRILSVIRGSKKLKGTFNIRSLENEDLDYDALLYIWGDQTELDDFLIYDQRCKVGRNLYEALVGLYGKGYTRPVYQPR
jgi:hypothetical protein